MIRELKTLSLVDILPDNLLADEQIYATVKALDKELQLVAEDCKQVIHLSRIDELPEPVVDLLAWQWHVDFYEQGMALPTKRRMVKQSIAWHRRKGTPSAVEEVATAVFGESKVSEWFEYGGEPYHFRIDLLSAPEITPENLDLIVKVVNTVKNVRSWLDSIGFTRAVTGTTYYGVAVHLHKKYAVGPAQVRDTYASGRFFIGGISQLHKKYKVEQSGIYDTSLYSPYKAGGGVYMYKKFSIEEES